MSTPTQPRYEPPPPAVSIQKSRPGLIGLAAAATMLILIGAIGNPPATRSLIDNADLETFSGRLRASLSTFSWHLTDLGNDFGHLFLANVLMDVAVVLLVFAFVVVVTSGSGSFWRTFLGTWIAVIAASVIGGYVRSSVVDEKFADPTLHSKAEAIFFSVSSPGATLVFAGLAFGVFVAIVAGVVAIATRRDEVVSADRPYAPYPPPAVAESDSPAQTGPTNREPWSAPPAAPGPVEDEHEDDTDRTTQLPAVGSSAHTGDDDDDHTRQLPPVEHDR
jgi:hypothetical protein